MRRVPGTVGDGSDGYNGTVAGGERPTRKGPIQGPLIRFGGAAKWVTVGSGQVHRRRHAADRDRHSKGRGQMQRQSPRGAPGHPAGRALPSTSTI